MSDESTTKRKTKRIDKRRNYLFGPVPRGFEFETDAEIVSFTTTAEHGVNYPREYPGSYFTDSLGINTFEDYLTRNPEGLKPGRRFFFYEKNDDGSATLLVSGTMMPQALDNQGRVSDGATQQGLQAATLPPFIINQQAPQNDRHNRAAMEDLIETMKSEIDSLREQVVVKDRRVDEMQRSVIDAEQRRLAAEANLSVAISRHEMEIADLKERHTSELANQKALHEKDVEIITRNATDEANKVMNERLSDIESKGESMGDRAMEMISDFAPILNPIVSKLGEAGGMFLEEWVDRMRERRAARKGLPTQRERASLHTTAGHDAQQPSAPAQQQGALPPQQQLTQQEAVDASSIFGAR